MSAAPFYKALMLIVSDAGIGGDPVMFNSNGDGLGRYDIYQYQKTPDGDYQYKRVGEWTDK